MLRRLVLIAAGSIAAMALCEGPAFARWGHHAAQPEDTYSFDTWKQAIDDAPCSAFVHIGPGMWKMAATFKITGDTDRPKDLAWGQSVHAAANSSVTDANLNKPLETDILDRRCIAEY